MLYEYNGAIWNGNVIYKRVVEYVHASSKRHAIVLLERRYKHLGYIKCKEANLHERPKISS